MIRGWFRCGRGARLVAVSWRDDLSAWVNLLGEPVPNEEVLKNWGED